MGLAPTQLPPPPVLEPPPVPAETGPGRGAGVLVVIALAIEAIGLWRGRIGNQEYDADWIDWLQNPEREILRRRSQRIARHCCEVIAEEGQRMVHRVPDVFEPNETKSDDNARRYGRVSTSRRN